MEEAVDEWAVGGSTNQIEIVGSRLDTAEIVV
jgi:hypothetical protein